MSTDINLPEVGTKTHAYAQGGNYTVVITDESDASRKLTKQITVPFGLLIFVTEDTADTDRRSINLRVNNGTHGLVNVNWGDGTLTTTNPGNNTTLSKHKYAMGGTYTVTVTDADQPSRTATRAVTVPFTGTVLGVTTAEEPGDVDRRTTRATVANPEVGKTYQVQWTAAGSWTDLPTSGSPAHSATNKYAAAGTNTATIRDKVDTTKTASAQVTVPYGPPLPVVTVTQSTADSKKMTISVVVDNHGNGPVGVAWGDSTANGTNAGDGVAATTHKYAEDATYTVTVTDANDPTLTATRQAVVPFEGGLALTVTAVESSPAGPDRRTVTASWDNQDQGVVTVNWGDATATQSGPSAGTLNHVYAAAGTFTVTVTDSTTNTRTQTAQVTVPFTG